MMRAAFDRRRQTIVSDAQRHRRRRLRRARGRVLRLPLGQGAARAVASGDNVRRASAELAEICINEAKVAVVPGEAFGAPGYFRMSYALGDDDLVEGVSRLAALFAEAQD